MRYVIKAIIVQFILAIIIVKIPLGRKVVSILSDGVTAVVNCGKDGLSFVFGDLADGSRMSVFFVQSLGGVVFVSALVELLYYVGALGFVVKWLGKAVGKLMGTTAVESFVAVANMFLGQTSSPVLVSKYIGKMTDSEIMVILVSGMGSMEVSILAGYAACGIPMEYLLIASVLVPVGSILVAKMILPETQQTLSIDDVKMDNKGSNSNVIDAVVGGASTGMSMIVGIASSLIAVLGLVALINLILGIVHLDLETIFSYVSGKDTMTGHWEMMGLHITKPFRTFTETGFPKELLDELSERTGRVIIGNKSASGTEILDELAEEEIAAGHMIVYTSADSVLQICGNEETFGLEELYRCCEIARELTMKDEWKVGRVIARPYVGRKKGEFKRTSNRHDYALKPYGRTALNVLKDAGYDVISVGKIFDIFDGEGITESNKSKSSVHGMEQTIEIAKRDFEGLCFVNLVDFDALWGHRRNVTGYARELEKFDEKLGELLNLMKEDDLLIITADHGNDPTHTGTDHTREKVPFLAFSPSMRDNGKLEEAQTFAVVGATIADNFGVEMPENTIGSSLLNQLV